MHQRPPVGKIFLEEITTAHCMIAKIIAAYCMIPGNCTHIMIPTRDLYESQTAQWLVCGCWWSRVACSQFSFQYGIFL